MIGKPGVYRISFEEYLSDPCPVPSLSRSVIKDLIFKTPAHARFNHVRLNPDCPPEKQDDKFSIGTAAHSLFLQGIDVAEVIDAPDWRTKDAKAAREAARLAGKVPLLKVQYEEVKAMVQAAYQALTTSDLDLVNGMAGGDSELTYIWQEDETWFKIRPDWISKDRTILLDFKTTDSIARPENYSGIATNTGLDIQDALYTRGVRVIEGIAPKFVLMVQEVNPPYLCSFPELDPMFFDMGAAKVERGIDLWRHCMKTNHWPGYPKNVVRIEPPAWALAQWESRQCDIENQLEEAL